VKHLKVLAFLSKGCANPEMNNVKTFDYFCHNTMITVRFTTINPR